MIKLESQGKVASTPAGSLKVGDTIMFNFGLLGTVKGFGVETTKTVELLMYSHESEITTVVKWKKDKQVVKV